MVAYFYSGQRLTSALMNGLPQPLGAAVVGQAGAYLTTSAAAELKLPKLALTGITLASGAARRFRLDARLAGGTVNDAFEFRIRQTNDTTGTIMVAWRCPVLTANQFDVSFENLDVATSVVSNDTFYLSAIRLSGTGTITVQGDKMSSLACDSALTSSVVRVVP